MSMVFIHLGAMMLLTKLSVMVLSVWMGVGVWVAHFGECVPCEHRRVAVDVKDAKRGIGGGGHDSV